MTPEEKMQLLRQNGVRTIDSPELIIDTIKQPVKVSANMLDENSDDVNTVWAEKADYLNEDNLGEGLRNKAEFVKDSFGNIIYDEVTYSLNVAPASKDAIGGIRLPADGSITVNPDNGEVDFDFVASAVPATPTTLGCVKPQPGGILSYDSADGTLSANYELPTAGADVKGGVMIGKARGEDYPLEYRDRNLRIENITNAAVYTKVLDRFQEYDNVGNIKYTLDYTFVSIINRLMQSESDINTLSLRLAKYFDKILSSSGTAILFGQGTFKSSGKGYAEIKFAKPLKNNHYHVAVAQLSSSGRVGELSATEYSTEGFKVYNTGKSQVDVFIWIVIPSEITYVDKPVFPDKPEYDTLGNMIPITTLPIKRGTSMFNGTDGVTVSIENAVMYCSDRSANKITISSFPEDADHGSNGAAFKIDGNTNDKYTVLITPSIAVTGGSGQLDTGGVVGEIWVENKTSTTFTVKCSGKNSTGITFDWIAIPYRDDMGNVLDNSELNYDVNYFPVRCGSVTSVDGVATVDFGRKVYSNTDYLVFYQLASDTGSHFGEYSVSEYDRTRSMFELSHTGSATEFTVDWIVIDI